MLISKKADERGRRGRNYKMPVCCARSCREPQLMVMGGTGDMGQRRNLLPCHFCSYSEVRSALSVLCSVDSPSLKSGRVLKEIKFL